MAHMFVTDGYPEADEYANNYVFYDASDPASIARANEQVKRMRADREAFERQLESG